jgi:OOP family OmpA-OmpF porin
MKPKTQLEDAGLTSSSARPSPEPIGGDGSSAERGKLDELRSLLLAPEQNQIVNLQTRLTDPKLRAEDIGNTLPDAVRFALSRNDELGTALGPLVEDSIRVSVKKDPAPLADALFPVMGPAIRKAIAMALSSMVQSLNQTLEHSLSLRGLKWRFEAFRTGKPFAEVVLLHTLVYRVEQVLLIHKETGLLLQHVTAPSVDVRDVDMVSGMLTAIQDFAHDSFRLKSGESLETMRLGELTIWVEPGPLAVLAGVIRGSARNDLRPVFQHAIETIHREHRQLLESFRGETAPFVSSKPQLESCLQVQYGSASARRFPLPLVIVAALLLGILGYWTFFSIRSHRRWQDMVSRLRSEPGLVLVSAEKREGKYFITGLRDSLAADPNVIVRQADIDPAQVVGRWEPYQSTAMPFVLTRAKAMLNPPETVNLTFEKGVLSARGLAGPEWIATSKRVAQFIPGIVQFHTARLADSHTIGSIRQRINQAKILFATGNAIPAADQNETLDRLASEIRALLEAAQPSGASVLIEIVGQTDSSGSEEINQILAQQRAESVLEALVARNIRQLALSARAGEEPLRSGTANPNDGRNRRVDFNARVTPPSFQR